MSVRAIVSVSLALLTAAGAAPLARAQDEPRVKLALQLLDLMQSRRMVEQQMDLMLKAQLEVIRGLAGKSQSVGAEDLKKIEALQHDVRDLIMAELGWDTIARDAGLIYASVFTDDELRAMIVFFESPPGRAWIDKSPEIAVRMTDIMQLRIKAVVPKVQELVQKRLRQ